MMTDREKVISWLEGLAEDDWRECYSDSEVKETARQALNLIDELLKEQEAVWNVLHDLCELGYPHNFQREAPWVVDYLYELTEIIKKAFKAKEGR